MGKREVLANTLERTGTGQLLSSTLGRWKGLVVFNYHRIGDPTASLLDRGLLSASQEQFDQQVRFLKKNYDVIGVDDLSSALNDPAARSVMISFDDGYRDNYELAFPVLQQHHARALFFITSGFLDEKPVAWWDEISWMIRSTGQQQLCWPELFSNSLSLHDEPAVDRAIYEVLLKFKATPEDQTVAFLERLGELTGTGRCPASLSTSLWMTWDMVCEMNVAGMDIGGHTVHHPVLANCDVERQRTEIEQSKSRIEAELLHPITAFSYPVGQPDSFTEETKSLLQQAGYQWGFSFYGGYCPVGQFDPFDLKRMPVERRIEGNLFRSIARLPQLFARK